MSNWFSKFWRKKGNSASYEEIEKIILSSNFTPMKPEAQFSASLKEKLLSRLEQAKSAKSKFANFFRQGGLVIGTVTVAVIILIVGSFFYVKSPTFFGGLGGQGIPLVKAGSDTVPVNFPIRVSFPHDVSLENLQKYFSVMPETAGTVALKDNVLTFDHEKFLKYDTEYTLKVSKDASTAMTEDFTMTFKTRGRFRTQLYLASRMTLAHYTLNSYEPEPEVSLTFPYSGTYTAKAYRVTPEKLIDFIVASENFYFEGEDDKSEELFNELRKDLVDTQKVSPTANADRTTEATLYKPVLSGEGLYFVEFTGKKQNEYDDGVYRIFLTNTKYAMSSKRLGEKLATWLVDTKSAAGVPNATVKAYGKEKTVMFEGKTNNSGVYETSVTQDWEKQPRVLVFDIGTEKIVQLVRVSWMSIFDADYSNAAKAHKGFVMTDRPLYKPGDKVQFKAMLRKPNEPDYDGSIKRAKVEVMRDQYGLPEESIFKKEFDVTRMGSFAGEFNLSQHVKTGEYVMNVTADGKEATKSNFAVEVFQKPEFEVSVKPEKEIYISGDTVKVEVSAKYFFGTPVKNQKVTVDLVESYYWEEVLPDATITGTLNSEGRFTAVFKNVKIANKSYYYSYWGRGGIPLSVRARVSEDTGKTMTKKALISMFPAEYELKAEEPSPLWQVKPRAKTNFVFRLQKVGMSAEEVVGIPNASFDLSITKRTWNKETYNSDTEEVKNEKLTTDSFGKAAWEYQFERGGSYDLVLSTTDPRGNAVELREYFWVPDAEYGIYYDQSQPISTQQISLIADRDEYRVGETAKVSVYLPQTEGDVYLSVNTNDMRRVWTQKISGTEMMVDVPVTEDLVPGFFLFAETYNGDSFFTGTRLINVTGKKMTVSITPSHSPVYPKEKANIIIETKDEQGNPVASETAITVIDKSILALRHYTDPKIFDAFYTAPNEYFMKRFTSSDSFSLGGAEKGGCFLPGTRILMADGTTKPIEEIKAGDEILTRASQLSDELVKDRVARTFEHTVGEYLVLNGWLKVTSVHRMFVNGEWKMAGEIRIGDSLLDSTGNRVIVNSIEKVSKLVKVYNFETQLYHTYFANGIYVHNDKGGDSRPRKDFLDTAYWNAFVSTGSDGKADVSFDVPDNLTTWVALGKSLTLDTKVGEGEGEFIVTKDLFIRPSLPLFARTGDELEVLASIHNNTAGDFPVKALMKATGATITNETTKELNVGANNVSQVKWNIHVDEGREVKLEFSVNQVGGELRRVPGQADPAKLVDNLEQKFPIYPALTPYTRALTGIAPDETSFEFKRKGDVSITLSSSVLSILPDVIEKLTGYPYGCVEQTMSKHLPNVLIKKHSGLLGIDPADDLDAQIKAGFERLLGYQHDDGSFGWWENDEVNIWMTGYVMEGFLEIKDLGGLAGYEKMYDRTLQYLKDTYTRYIGEEKVYVTYVMSRALPGEFKLELNDDELSALSSESLGYAALANFYNGDKKTAKRIVEDFIMKRLEDHHWEHTSTITKDGHDDLMSDRYLTTGVNLNALLTIGGASEKEIRGIVQWLMDHRGGYQGLWGSTRQSSQVLFSLVKFIQKYDEFDPDFEYTITLNGDELQKGKARSTKFSKDIEIPRTKLKKKNTLSFKTEGKGSMYYTLRIDDYVKASEIPQGSDELVVTRRYLKGEQEVSPAELQVGDVVTVELAVKSLGDLSFVMIEDMLPSGFDIINDRLTPDDYSDDKSRYNWRGSNTDIRDERITFFDSYFYGGLQHYWYRARVARRGTFSAPAPRVEPMYNPTLSDVGSEVTLEVR